MKKELLKGFTMLTLIITLALVSAAVSAQAQTPGHKIVADVPFDFIVGDKTFQAGEITVRRTGDSEAVLLISNANSRQGAFRLTNSVQAAKTSEKAKLVFNKYGDRYYLSQVWTSGTDSGRELLKSRSERATERELARNASQNQLAKDASQPEAVVIIARVQ